nr:molybdenum cofactor guanylyltransferase [Paenibacillus pectinilyticus]
MTGVILAGGLNRRMGGQSKALLPVQGEAIMLRQLKEMARWCQQVIVVTNEPDTLQPMLAAWDHDVLCVSDIYLQKGPLSGIHAASSVAQASHLWIVGCDMPYISGEAAEAMLTVCRENNVDAIIPELNGRLHPLHGIYARDVGSEAELLLREESYRLMGLLDHLDWQPAQAAFFEERHIRTDFAVNINTPDEYKDMLDNLSL